MGILVNLVLSTLLLPPAGIYNAYVRHNMEIDVPPASSGPEAPIRDYAKPIFIEGEGKKAVLMIHGFSGSPRDFGNLPKLFNARGYDVIAPLLPAHGRGARAMSYASAEEWRAYVEATYKETRSNYDELVVIGLSMGSSLSLLTAVEQADNPADRMIFLSPFFQVRQEWYYFFSLEAVHDVLSRFVPYLQSLPGQSAVCKESPHAKRFVRRQYVSTQATSAAFEIAKAARWHAPAFGRLNIPTLVLQSRNDRVTDYETTRRILQSMQNPGIRLITLNRANHVLPRDCEAGLIEETVLGFVTP